MEMLPEGHDAADYAELKRWTDRAGDMGMIAYDVCPGCGYVYYDSPRRPDAQNDTIRQPDGTNAKRKVCGRTGCNEERWTDRVQQTPRKRFFYLPLKSIVSAHFCRTDLLVHRRRSHRAKVPPDGATDVHETRAFQAKMRKYPEFAESVSRVESLPS